MINFMAIAMISGWESWVAYTQEAIKSPWWWVSMISLIGIVSIFVISLVKEVIKNRKR